MIGLKRGTVRLYDHEKEWEMAADITISQLKSILGSVAEDIQHIGSTSIVYIKAKPIIDIAVAVVNFNEVLPLIPKLENAGYCFRPASIPESQMLFACGSYYEGGDMQTHFIHVVVADSMEWHDMINFRNYMNTFPEKAKAYEKIKIELAAQYHDNCSAYLDGKDKFIKHALRKALVWSYLGKSVTVKIDRPMGSVHPKHPQLIYPINYGYVPGVLGGDGEELDVYVLGINEPIAEVTGRVVGIIHRENDVEDKLVAAPDGIVFNQAEITEAVHFQEQYYSITIDSLFRKSCGAIVFKKENATNKYLLLFQKKSQTWSFPKGHMEAGEKEEETAIREIFEETGCTLYVMSGFKTSVEYRISDIIKKQVVLFIAELNCEPVIREDGIEKYRWVSANEAKALLYKEYADVLDDVEEYLK